MRNSSLSKGDPHMTIIQGLSETMDKVQGWFRPNGREFVQVYQERWVDGLARKTFYVGLIACATIGPSLPLTAWTADPSSFTSAIPRTAVAAGVGYQNAETSTIIVKTYDAENGEILSEETYELNVREDATLAVNQPRERIFAGGVGPGADGLSAFTLRVYDATTGRFLWEGLLNLDISNQELNSTHQVVAHLVALQATASQVRSQSAIDGQPQFALSAVDSETGQLMWTDQFSVGTGRLARTERVSRAVVGQTESLATPSQQIEFRIRMTDDRDRNILWEDTIKPTEGEADLAAEYNDAAEILPAWRGEGPEEMNKEEI
jgi:hypothetical protein